MLPDRLLAVEPGSDLIRFAPELVDADEAELTEALIGHDANLLISERPCPATVLRHWTQASEQPDRIAVHLDAGARAAESWAHSAEWSRYDGLRHGVHRLAVPFHPAPLARALGSSERLLQRLSAEAEYTDVPVAATHRGGPHEPSGPGLIRPQERHIVLVGLGIVNLVTAHFLAHAGHRVTCLDGAPDPRHDHAWTAYGCSRGGGNARMFTLTECDDYHDKSLDRAGANGQFRDSVSSKGWLTGELAPDDEAWIADFERVPGWLARTYNADIFALSRRSGVLWHDWIDRRPDLFGDVGLRAGILRLYGTADALRHGRARQDMVGATQGALSADDVRRQYPALSGAAADAFAGGVAVSGFTLQVHDLMAALLDELELRGARLRFDEPVADLRHDTSGRVAGIVTARGESIEADDYVLSPGAVGWWLGGAAGVEPLVRGVLGCWATVPNVEPRLEHSLKIVRPDHFAVDANVTVGRDSDGAPSLIVGSGYGYVGTGEEAISPAELELTYRAVVDTIRTFFPAALEAAGEQAVHGSFRYCVRPWTASNLGVFARQAASHGQAIWTGGHNTGGFAQAPVVAEAVLASLNGAFHPMHAAYHPARLERLAPASAATSHAGVAISGGPVR
jgi:glycine/D-amino acid oxidase-like deaminating enzyme